MVLKKFFENAWEDRVCENANLFSVERGTLQCKTKEEVENVYFDMKPDVCSGGTTWLEYNAACFQEMKKAVREKMASTSYIQVV